MFAHESVMEILKEFTDFAVNSGWYVDGESTQNGFLFYNAQTNDRWIGWQAAQAQAVPEWISVKEKTPPTDETVLVCWDYHPDVEPEKEYITLDEDLNEYWPNCEAEPPTHWKLIPKPPKAQEQRHE
jgi:hypothetical protein